MMEGQVERGARGFVSPTRPPLCVRYRGAGGAHRRAQERGFVTPRRSRALEEAELSQEQPQELLSHLEEHGIEVAAAACRAGARARPARAAAPRIRATRERCPVRSARRRGGGEVPPCGGALRDFGAPSST